MNPIQVGQCWAIARKWHNSLTCVDIYATAQDEEPSMGVYQLYSGKISISIDAFDRTNLSVIEARSLASLLETAAAIAGDWSSWVEGDRSEH